MPGTVLTVTQVNFFIRSLLEGDGRLSDILISGEISNFTRNARSGHLYFSLKDQNSVLRAVMFAGAARRLRFAPTDGLRVLVRGRISVYEPAGQYQLYAEDIQPDGVGALGLAFEQLKNRLEAEGLFAHEHKRPIPKYPHGIGVITSPTGAAIRDILDVTGRRWPLGEILFCPSPVQGSEAPERLRAAVELLSARPDCDVIILGRGGGSAEDLWAFNDEALARAVYASRVPVISAVGHETDFTICDFVADLRAPTPSAAAELCTPEVGEELGKLALLRGRLESAAQELLGSLRQRLDLLTLDSPLAAPEAFLDPVREALGRLMGRLLGSYTEQLEDCRGRLGLTAGRLDAMSPLKVLSRGYCVARRENGQALRDAKDAEVGEALTLTFSKGRLRAAVTEKEE